MKYTYCLVRPIGHNKDYYYICEIDNLHVGDCVEIPFGFDNSIVKGRVISIRVYDEVDRPPYPPAKTKRIIRVLELEQNSKDYLYCAVKPITHKHKTFYYISDIPVKPGDFVDIPFGPYNDVRIGQVLEVEKYNANGAPIPLYETKKIKRILSAENSDYVRFLTLNQGSHIINPKPRDSLEKNQTENRQHYSIKNMEDVDKLLSLMENLDELSVSCKVNLLEDLDRYCSAWGAEHHQYKVKPRVFVEEVRNFERVYEVRLPEEYVRFITEFGNGAMGICELDVWNYHPSLNYLKYEFPLGEYGDDVNIEKLCENQGFVCPDDGECETCVYHQECPGSYWVDDYEKIDYRYLFGTLPLSYQGCTYTERLVVTGPRAGSVWMDNEGVSMICIANSFNAYIHQKLNGELWTLIEVLKLIKQRKNSQEIVKSNLNRYTYFDIELLLCGMLAVDVSPVAKENDILLLRLAEDALAKH